MRLLLLQKLAKTNLRNFFERKSCSNQHIFHEDENSKRKPSNSAKRLLKAGFNCLYFSKLSVEKLFSVIKKSAKFSPQYFPRSNSAIFPVNNPRRIRKLHHVHFEKFVRFAENFSFGFLKKKMKNRSEEDFFFKAKYQFCTKII